MGSKTIALPLGLMLVLALAIAPAAVGASQLSADAQVAVAHLASELSDADLADVTVTDEYTSAHNGVTHVYLRQRVEGLDVLDAVATVNVSDGVVVHSGSRLVPDLADNASGQQVLDAGQALTAAALAADAEPEDAHEPPALVYQKLDDDTARLAYNVHIVTAHHWWSVSIDAENGEVLSMTDFVDHEDMTQIAARTARPEHAHVVESVLSDPILPPEQVDDGSSYNVYPMPMESPLDGDRSIVENPADAVASPYGWHDTNGVVGPEHTITRGNNVNAYADTAPQDNQPDVGSQPDGGRGLDFDHPIRTFDATPAVYRDAAVTNLFYWNNVMHDVTYRYGFDEAAGNFQASNYSVHGRGGDEVQAEAQDGGFVLNANFATPPDGQPGRMQMFLWVDAFRSLGLGPDDLVREYSHEVRDGDLDAGVIAHEYGHGISNRLVGGPTNVSCLRTHDERQGEGWSDWWTYVMTMRDGDDGETPRGIGNYVTYYDEEGRQGPGVRTRPYSRDMEINDHTYNSIRTAREPHGVGEVWASMLWDLYWNLVDEYGFNPNPYESWETGGNNLAIQLVVDGMKFAPCEPGFVDARDAIIAADAMLTGGAGEVRGANECLIWHTFARRGLGWSAEQGNPASKVDGTEGYDVPTHCEGA